MRLDTAREHLRSLVQNASDMAAQERRWVEQRCESVKREQKRQLIELDGRLSSRWEQYKLDKKRSSAGGNNNVTINNNITISGGNLNVAGGIGSNISGAGGNFSVGGNISNSGK